LGERERFRGVELSFVPLKAGVKVDWEWHCPVLIRGRDYRDPSQEPPLAKAEDLPEEEGFLRLKI